MENFNQCNGKYIELCTDGILRLSGMEGFHSIINGDAKIYDPVYNKDCIICFPDNLDVALVDPGYPIVLDSSYIMTRFDTFYFSPNGQILGMFRPNYIDELNIYSDGSAKCVDFIDHILKEGDLQSRMIANTYASLNYFSVSSFNDLGKFIRKTMRTEKYFNSRFADRMINGVPNKLIRKIIDFEAPGTPLITNKHDVRLCKYLYKVNIESFIMEFVFFVEAVRIADKFMTPKDIIIPNSVIFDFLFNHLYTNGIDDEVLDFLKTEDEYMKSREKIPHRFRIMDIIDSHMENYNKMNFKIKYEYVDFSDLNINPIDINNYFDEEEVKNPSLENFLIEL